MNNLGLLLALIIYQPTDVTIAIEVAGKGPKLIIVKEKYEPLFIDSASASPLKDAANGIMTNYSMTLTTVAVAELLIKGKEKAKEKNWHIKNQVIVASSSISETKNSKSLFSQIQSSTGEKVCSVTAKEEARLTFQAVVPKNKRNDALIVDVGSGNSRVAWVDEDDKVKEITIPLGTVTATNLMNNLQKAIFELKIKELVKIPLPQKETAYVTGGSAWALQTIINPPTELYTPFGTSKVRVLDIQAEYSKLKSNQHKISKVFSQENLIAGSNLLLGILDNFPENQKIIFVNNPESWVIEFLKEQEVNK